MPLSNLTCPVDTFGLVMSPLLHQLLNQSSNRRLRKSALINIVRTAKATKVLPRDTVVQSVGIVVNCGGEIMIQFVTGIEEPHEQPAK